MKKSALIIHGYEGSNQGNWFPWLRGELEKLDFTVDNPQFPDADHPVESEWTETIRQLWRPEIAVTPESDEHNSTYRTIIGHSLGGTETLRALELDWATPIDLAILVAATNNDGRRPQLANFFTTPFDFEKIQKNCKKFILIFSDNDPYIKLETGPNFQHNLGPNAELFMLHEAGHLMKRDGYEQFPMLLELLKKSIN